MYRTGEGGPRINSFFIREKRAQGRGDASKEKRTDRKAIDSRKEATIGTTGPSKEGMGRSSPSQEHYVSADSRGRATLARRKKSVLVLLRTDQKERGHGGAS